MARSVAKTDSLRESLAPIAPDLEAAARDSNNLAQRDACAVLAAVANGDPIPRDAAERVVDRAEGRR